MANRNTLHINKLEDFKNYLSCIGFEIQPTKGFYEVLRAKKDKRTVIVYEKSEAKEHLTVQDKDTDLLREFINYINLSKD